MNPVHHEFMAEALRLGRKGLYTTHPNPRVGCVIVRDGVIVGRGAHLRAGEPHAEIHALREAGDLARGATAYVTLEPCAHHGRTPPCANALVAAGLKQVVIATLDPNPLVAGRGVKILLEAGIDVQVGILEQPCRELNAGFIKRMEKSLPYVRVKMAMSVDGRTAMASGESQWITGEAARQDVQFWRAQSACVLSTAATVIHDQARLDVRLDAQTLNIEGQVRQPVRVILDPHLRLTPDLALFAAAGPIWLVTASKHENEALERFASHDVDVLVVAEAEAGLDLEDLMAELSRRQINEVHVEAGARLAGSLMRLGLVDEWLIYMAPLIMGSSARPLLQLPLERMAEKQELHFLESRSVGSDLRLRYLVAR